MPDLQPPNLSQGLEASEDQRLDSPNSSMHEERMPVSSQDDRGPDYYEAQSIKWNTARIVRLSSGKFALFSPFNEGAIDLISVGTIEEIAGLIPTYDQCVEYCETAKPVRKTGPRGTAELLADIGL